VIIYEIPQAEKDAISAQVRTNSPWVPRIDRAQAELSRLDERIAAAQAELEQIDSLIIGVSLDTDLTKVGIARMRRPLVAEHLGRLRAAAAPLRGDVERFEHRIQIEIGTRITAARAALRHAAEA
jgi:hypothetical protein